jgi:hypothetical protein
MSFQKNWIGFWCVVFFVVVLPLVNGCGKSGPEVVSVSGQVLIDGEPMAAKIPGFVQFVPAEGRPATGNIDPETGRFTLTTVSKDDGAVVGAHKVVVMVQQMVGQESVSLIPEHYSDLASTDLTATIDGPTDAVKIELTGPLKPAKPSPAGGVSDDPNKF